MKIYLAGIESLTEQEAQYVKRTKVNGLASFYNMNTKTEELIPYLDNFLLDSAEIVNTGLKLGVPYQLTWSCYEGKDKPCGVCGTCRDRAAAFAANNVKDPASEVGEA